MKFKKSLLALVVAVSMIATTQAVSASSSSDAQLLELTENLPVVQDVSPFNNDVILSGNKNYFGVTVSGNYMRNSDSTLSVDTNLDFNEQDSSLSENEVKVSGQVIVKNNGNSFPLSVDGIITNFTHNGKKYYFGPLLTSMNHNGTEVNGTVGVFYNTTDNLSNISIWMGEIGNENGSSLINYGASITEQTEVIKTFQEYLDNKNQKNAAILSLEDSENMAMNSEIASSQTLASTGDYFRNALNLGTSYISGAGKDGNASYWVANEHIYINDARSREQFTSTLLWRDKLYTNNDAVLNYIKPSSGTSYLWVNNYAVNVTLSTSDSTARMTDSTPTNSKLLLPVAIKPVKINAMGIVQIAYNSLASIWNSGLDKVNSGNSYTTFVNNVSTNENKAIDYMPGDMSSFPNPGSSNEYGMSHEIVAYAPDASTKNTTGTFTVNTNIVWYISNSNGWTGYPVANLNGSATFYTNW